MHFLSVPGHGGREGLLDRNELEVPLGTRDKQISFFLFLVPPNKELTMKLRRKKPWQG